MPGPGGCDSSRPGPGAPAEQSPSAFTLSSCQTLCNEAPITVSAGFRLCHAETMLHDEEPGYFYAAPKCPPAGPTPLASKRNPAEGRKGSVARPLWTQPEAPGGTGRQGGPGGWSAAARTRGISIFCQACPDPPWSSRPLRTICAQPGPQNSPVLGSSTWGPQSFPTHGGLPAGASARETPVCVVTGVIFCSNKYISDGLLGARNCALSTF